jgi:hypothetical protein
MNHQIQNVVFLARTALLIATRGAFLMMVACWFANGQQPSPSLPNGKAESKTGTVSGRATLKGKPAPGVTVALKLNQQNYSSDATFKATTDEEGNYRIAGVPAGSYQVTPAAPAFVSKNQTVVVAEGEAVDGIDFALVRGGVITGKVTDADGRPVVEQTVSLISADIPVDRVATQSVYSIPNVQTDDRGIYRMFGVAAGRYKVTSGQSQNNFFQSLTSGKASYKQTFHPDVTDPAQATIVEVTEGSEASNIDIGLGRAAQTFAASGQVVNGDGQPVSNVRFILRMIVGSSSFGAGNGAASNSLGEFRIENLAPAKYVLSIMPQPGAELRADAVNLEIVDQDIEGLMIKTAQGASLAGTVVLENSDDKSVLAKVPQLQIFAFVQTQGLSGNFGRSVALNADGSFLVTGLDPGKAYLSIGGQQQQGFSIARTELGGVIQPQGIELKADDHLTGVRLVVRYGNATVYGVVNIVNGTLPAGAVIRLQVNGPGDNAAYIQPPPVDARGHFLIQNLPGGTYDFTVTVYNPAPGRMPPAQTKQQVVVANGVTNEVTLTIDLSRGPGTPTP